MIYNKIQHRNMQKSSLNKLNLSKLQTDLQLNYNGHFLIVAPQHNSSKKFIENNKHRNWNESQLEKFAAFLFCHHQKLQTIDTRKANRIFKVLSQYIKTRNVNQCRTFTIKMIRQFGTIQRLNQFFEESLANYDQIVKRQKNNLENMGVSWSQKKKEGKLTDFANQEVIKMGTGSLNEGQLMKNHQQLKPTDTEYPMEENGLTKQFFENNNNFNFQMNLAHVFPHQFLENKAENEYIFLPFFFGYSYYIMQGVQQRWERKWGIESE